MPILISHTSSHILCCGVSDTQIRLGKPAPYATEEGRFALYDSSGRPYSCPLTRFLSQLQVGDNIYTYMYHIYMYVYRYIQLAIFVSFP